jgi:hypothetical protein
MMYVLIRHKVADFGKWKQAYDADITSRQRAGLKETHLLHNVQDHEEVVLLLEVADLQKAMEFCHSSDLRDTMQKAGVVTKPDMMFLSR